VDDLDEDGGRKDDEVLLLDCCCCCCCCELVVDLLLWEHDGVVHCCCCCCNDPAYDSEKQPLRVRDCILVPVWLPHKTMTVHLLVDYIDGVVVVVVVVVVEVVAEVHRDLLLHDRVPPHSRPLLDCSCCYWRQPVLSLLLFLLLLLLVHLQLLESFLLPKDC